MFVDLILNLISILVVIAAIFVLCYIKNNERDNILKKVNNLPIPMLVIDYHTNTVITCNDLLFDIIGKRNIKGRSMSTLQIFQDFNAYLQIKSLAESNCTKTAKVTLNVNRSPIIIKISYNIIDINLKKYLVVAMENKTNIANYIKSLGIFTAMIDKSNDGIIISKINDTNSSPEIVYANNSTEIITGIKHDELLDAPLLSSVFLNHIPDDSYDNLFANIKKAKSSKIECKYTKNNGDMCWLIITIMPINKNNIIESLSKLDRSHEVCEIMALELCDIDLYITIKQTDITMSKNNEECNKIEIERLKTKITEKNKINEMLIHGFIDMLKVAGNGNSLSYGIETLCKALNGNNAFIARLFSKDNKHYIRYINTWPNDTSKYIDEDDVKILFDTLDGFELYANLITHRIYKMYLDTVKSPAVKEMFMRNNIKSGMLCPIFNGDDLVGFIGICETTDVSRTWDENAENMIKIVADSIGELI